MLTHWYYPYLTSAVWPGRNVLITKEILIKQHKRMAQIVLGVDTRTPTDQVLNQLNWTKLEQR